MDYNTPYNPQYYMDRDREIRNSKDHYLVKNQWLSDLSFEEYIHLNKHRANQAGGGELGQINTKLEELERDMATLKQKQAYEKKKEKTADAAESMSVKEFEKMLRKTLKGKEFDFMFK